MSAGLALNLRDGDSLRQQTRVATLDYIVISLQLPVSLLERRCNTFFDCCGLPVELDFNSMNVRADEEINFIFIYLLSWQSLMLEIAFLRSTRKAQ